MLMATNFMLGALILAFGGAYLYAKSVDRPMPDAEQMEPYLAEARERFEKHADELGEETAQLARELLPPVSDAIYSRAQKDYPHYIAVLETQGDEFLSNMEQMFIAKVKGNYREYLRAHRRVIQEEFPEYASDENVELLLKDFEQTLDRLIERYYLDEFRRESSRTAALWKELTPLERPGPNELPLDDQLVDYVADWTVLAVADSVPPTPAR